MVLALFVTAIVGSVTRTSAATGTIYVTNEWAKRTTEPGQSTTATPPAAYDTATNVYSTYVPDTAGGETARLIQASANLVKVIYLDTGFDITTTLTDDVGTTLAIGGPGTLTLIQVTSVSDPIAGTVSDIGVWLDAGGGTKGTDLIASGQVTVTDLFAGNGTTIKGFVTLRDNAGDLDGSDVIIDYPTSLQNEIQDGVDNTGGALASASAVVKSDVDTTGVGLFLKETTRSSKRFEGYVSLVHRNAGMGVSSPATSATTGGAAKIRTGVGPLTIEIKDSSGNTRSTSVLVDVSPPTVTVSTPAHLTETQNRRPTFSGTVADAGSGLKVSLFKIVIDTDGSYGGVKPTNPVVFSAAGALDAGVTEQDIVFGTTPVNGDLNATFSNTPTLDLPTGITGAPNHWLAFQGEAVDLAGNRGFSDGDTASDVNKGVNSSATLSGQVPHLIKIDQVAPDITAALTGKYLDDDSDEVVDRQAIKVTFDGNVSTPNADDFLVKLDDGNEYVPNKIKVKDTNVYIGINTAIPSNGTPDVSIRSGRSISDLAGNTKLADTEEAKDGIAPKLTVTTSGGSGTGTGSEAADKLTKSKITVNVSSDENLSGSPKVSVQGPTYTSKLPGGTSAGSDAVATDLEVNGQNAVSQGANVWSYVFTASQADGARNVYVQATDASPQVNQANIGNFAEADDDTTVPSTLLPTVGATFTVDSAVPTPNFTPADSSTVTQKRPFVRVDYAGAGEVSTVTLTSATFNTADVLADMQTGADGKSFFFRPASDLPASNTLEVKAKDAAGNEKTSTLAFKVTDRTAFEIGLFPGWNAVSVPSNPLDPDIASVFTNTNVDQVVAFDATDSDSPWRIATQAGGVWSSSTTPPLTTIMAGMGVWVHSAQFATQAINLEGPREPGDPFAQPAIIEVASGANFVGVVDQNRANTEKGDYGTALGTAAAYFNGVNVTSAFTFDTLAGSFTEVVVSTDNVTIGDGMWIFVAPNNDGTVPPIVPK